jgi:hypothetical protein
VKAAGAQVVDLDNAICFDSVVVASLLAGAFGGADGVAGAQPCRQ